MDEVFEVPAQEFKTADPRLYPHPIPGFGYGTAANVYDASHVTVLHASGDYERLSGPSFFDAVLLRAMESVCADRERAVASCWRRRKLAAGSVFVDKPHNRVVVVYHHVDERWTDIHALHVYDVQNLWAASEEADMHRVKAMSRPCTRQWCLIKVVRLGLLRVGQGCVWCARACTMRRPALATSLPSVAGYDLSPVVSSHSV